MKSPVYAVDTNVVVAGLITDSEESPVAAILDAMLTGSIVYLLSAALLDEYRAVLRRPKIAKYHGLSESEIDQLLVELTANSIWSEPEYSAAAPDPGDDHLWSLLGTRVGSILLTGDQVLIRNPPARNVVMSPHTWSLKFSDQA